MRRFPAALRRRKANYHMNVHRARTGLGMAALERHDGRLFVGVSSSYVLPLGLRFDCWDIKARRLNKVGDRSALRR